MDSIIKSEYETLIFQFRGFKVMIDTDLAMLYGVPTKRLKEQVKRNIGRFPVDFMFELSKDEKDELVAICDRLGTLKHSSVNPMVFTEQGVSMLSSVLHSEKAIKINIDIMRAFARYRALLRENEELKKEILKLDSKLNQAFKFLLDRIDALHQKANAPINPIGYKIEKKMKITLTAIFILAASFGMQAQKINDSTSPLHLMKPAYDTSYGKPEVKSITEVLDRIYYYLDRTTPMALENKETQAEITDYSKVDGNTISKPGDFRLVSYEWGVTYAGMLLASEVTGDAKYATYTKNRLKFLAEIQPWFAKLEQKQPNTPHALARMLHPHALDDCGAMCAAMIKTQQMTGFDGDLKPMISTFADYISNKEFRFADGTLARNRPLPNSLWLDDLFMSVPALAQMGKYTGEKKYFDDAVKQVLQFSNRMFNPEKGLFMHGWILGMDEHPQFHWARANGWAVMTMVELLEVLPENHPGRAKVLDLLRKHIRGLANYQTSTGYWHQLIDRNDSYLETSATAIYTYSIARAINKGYVDAAVYGPMVCLAWNAVASKVNEQGQVEGTCVGTGMGFDPAFYYYRPVNVYAAHGYGPVLLAGAEMIQLIKTHKIEINDSALQLYK